MKREEWWSVTRRTKWKGRPFAEKLRAKWRERRRRTKTKRDGNGGGIEMRKIRQEESCVTGRNVPGRSRRFRDRPEALRFARIEGRRRGGRGKERYSFGTCIFFGHGHKTLRASEGNVCLEDVPRLPERHLHERGFLVERVNARFE